MGRSPLGEEVMLLCGHKVEHSGRTFKRDSEEGKKERAVQEVGEKQGHRPQARLDGRSKHAARGPDGGLGPRGRQCAERARGAEWCRALPHAVPVGLCFRGVPAINMVCTSSR